jgi:hypothetical protein
MPTAVYGPATGVIDGLVYVVGGANNSDAVVNTNQIYNPETDSWTTGAPMPTARYGTAGAVVDNILYVIGGAANGSRLNVVESFDATSNIWSTKSPMPTARDSIAAVVEGGIIYVIGGYLNNRLTTVESYNPATDTWTEEAPLSVGKSLEAAGLLGSTIVAAGGLTNSGSVTGDNEGYNSSTNSWDTLAPDPTARQASCFSTISGQLYVAGGLNDSGAVNVVESFNLEGNQWTTLASPPLAQVFPGYASVGNLLYCFGGSNTGVAGGTVYNGVQIYHPALPAPAILSGGVVPVFSTVTTIQPGEFVSIYGTNLGPSSPAIWTGNFPTSLGGTSVTIDGKAAYLLLVGSTQINLQAPNDPMTGPVPVVVTTGSGTASSTVTLAQFGPSFSLLDSKHVAGIIIRSDGPGAYGGGVYDIIGPTGSSLGYATVAASAGDTVEL